MLSEGGLAHALHTLLTREALTHMLTAQPAYEAALRLLGAVITRDPLKPLLLLPASGAPGCLEVRKAGVNTSGATVADAMAVLKRAALTYQKEGTGLNEVNDEGIHVGIDTGLQFVLFVASMAERCDDVRTFPHSFGSAPCSPF